MPVEEGFRVATAYVALAVADEDVQQQIEEAITAACDQAGQDGGTVLTEEIAAKVDGAAPELSAPLIDSLAGAGDVAASEISAALTEGIASGGDAGSAQLAAQLEAAVGEAGAEGGAQLAAGVTEATATVGEEVAARISEQLRLGLDEAAQASMAVLGQINAQGIGGTLAASAAGAGILSGLAARLADSAAEAGGAAGVELSRNLSEAAVAALSDEQFAAFTEHLTATASDAAATAGATAADVFATQMGSSLSSVDLIAEGLSTVGQSMTQQATDAAAAVADVESQSLTGT